MSLRLDGVEVVERLPGEPDHRGLAPAKLALALVRRTLLVAVLLVVGLGLWPLHLLAAAIWGRPPNVPRAAEVARYLGYVWTCGQDTLRVGHRLWLSLQLVRKFAVAPIWGLAWQLDELLYAGALDRVAIVEPLIEISAARSGSTQMARYLEQDPELLAPPVIQCMFPYLWLWRLVAATLGRVITPEALDARFKATLRPEFVERHELSLFRMDTLEVAFMFGQLSGVLPYLGPELIRTEFSLAEAAPHNRALWSERFVDYSERLMRKTMVWHGLRGAPGEPRMMIKGHFLLAADAMERRFPDARFLAIVRHPSPRVRSMINFLRVNPLELELGAPPWTSFALALADNEVRYCELEQAWFTRRVGARRCVIKFADYCADLEGSMAQVYRECLDLDELPAHVPREHTPRVRTNYAVDRSLAEVGIDRAALEAELADYIEWVGPC